ncbi:prolyl 4-hydroxylase subunit alpha-1-like [Drosophila ficusphila]|uniref:prolyl 4-hydroxylase subunit alpha-1-like n=1 Tax=Drosophila ficusphila TaxID=30025 RepID=UPI0007E78ABC|nr:prolyl 4-hydroxylase subunit alpha-1-like [Drosophila ficusphila]
MVKKWLFFAALTACIALQAKSQEASVPESYDFAISSESQLSLLKSKEIHVKNLQSYKDALEAHLKKIKKAIKHSENLLESSVLFQRNLFFGYKVFRHISKDWPQYLNLLKKKLGEEEISVSQDLLREQPTSTDFEESLGAIYRLQTIYNLDSTDMVHGILDGKDYKTKSWGIDECLILGLMYQYLKHYDQSEHWFRLALYHYDPNAEDLKIKVWKYTHLLEYMMDANKGLGDYSQAKRYANELLSILPNDTYIAKQLTKLEYLEANPPRLIKKEKDYKLAKKICSKHYKKKSSNLICQYLNRGPFLKLAPLKIEELSMDPNIDIFLDFVSEQDIEILKNVSRPKLQRIEDMSQNCNCKVADLSSSSNNIVRKINNLISDITGIPRNSNNFLEVINYGLAGNYNPDDTPDSKVDFKGHVLIYLSNAEKGGETVFPSLGVKFKPRKGSMLFWIDARGNPYHRQCPLIKGNMWLAKKVIT